MGDWLKSLWSQSQPKTGIHKQIIIYDGGETYKLREKQDV